MKLAIPAIFCFVFSAGFLAAEALFGRGLWLQCQSAHFAVTEAKVKSSRVVSSHSGHRTYKPEVTYDFSVGGSNYSSDQVRLSDATLSFAEAKSLAAKFPPRSTAQVHYDPANPAISALDASLRGEDLLLLLFFTPVNAILVGLWLWFGSKLREQFFRPKAGGVKIIADGSCTRVRLPEFGPLGFALVILGGASFVSLFIVEIASNSSPSAQVVRAVIAAVYFAGAVAFLWQWWKIQRGTDDLVVNRAEQRLQLPATQGRNQPLSTRLANVEQLAVKRIRNTDGKGRTYYTFAPTLTLRGGEAGEQKLADWRDQQKAEDFAAWLRQELGLGSGILKPRVDGGCPPD